MTVDSVDPNHEPLPEPPEPAPGAPLLSENDSKLLSSFFEDMTADHYNMPSFGEGLNFSDTWLDLPPQFMGSATSFGQQPAASIPPVPTHSLPHNLGDFHSVIPMGTNLMPPPPPPPPPTHLSSLDHREPTDDVLTAAATLLQNGSARRRSSNPNDVSFARRPVGPPVGHLRHQPLEEFREEGRRSISADHPNNDNTFTEWMFGPQERRFPRHALPTDVQYGSDSSFSPVQGFLPNSDRETADSMSQEQLKYLECLQPSQSTNNPQPGSPNYPYSATLPDHGPRLPDPAKGPDDVDAPPRKRRKSKNSREVVDDEGEEEISKTARRRKPKLERGGSVSVNTLENTNGGKRRKSSANGAKSMRENLSEEQKRENHIRSEQKRRTLIKEGFDDLCDLVPGLRGGGFSKSTMLTMAADWLEELLRGNEVLSAQLAKLEGR